MFATGEVPPSDSESETEDERAPLLARNRSAWIAANRLSVSTQKWEEFHAKFF